MLVYVPNFITLLRQRYSTLQLPGGIHYDNSAVLCRMQYEVRLEKKVGSKTIVVELIARYGKVEFRKPFAEDFLTTGDPSKVMEKINEYADEGYIVSHQTLMYGASDSCAYTPTSRM